MTVITAVSPAGLSTGLATAATSRSASSLAVSGFSAASDSLGQRDGDDQRPVDAGAEALGELVVGLALGRVGGEVAVVGLAELEVGRGSGERER